ncbi:MAG: hydrolase [Eubacteriales bacterium]|nr:hydrolase [Eubacteriales bacterium]
MAEETKEKKKIPNISASLRTHTVQIPEVVWKARGMVVLGRRIKSVIFTTDIAIIRNCNADAVLAVYPFTPQQVISKAVIDASAIPVFVGVGGGTTKGVRSALIARDAEAQGAFGVVVNSPMSNENIRLIRQIIDIPIVATVVSEDEDINARLNAGATILNVSAASKTPDLVRHIRKDFPDVPIIATGGPTEASILETIEAGANTISYTPPTCGEIFSVMMDQYRKDNTKNPFDVPDPKAGGITDFLKMF